MSTDLTGEINENPGAIQAGLAMQPGQLGGVVTQPVGEAPKDGVPYVRKDGLWEDGNLYFDPLIVNKHITAADSPYQALPNEFIIADATAGPITINAPATPTEGMPFAVKKFDATDNFVTIAAADIEARIVASGTSTVLFTESETMSFRYSTVHTRWIRSSDAGLNPWVEIYTATAIPGVPSTPQTIQWTFQPAFPGQPQDLVSLASGVFTAQSEASLDISMSVLWNFILVGNNEDALGLIDMTDTVAGLALFIEIVNSFAHARAGTYAQSANTTGGLDAAPGETFQFNASSDATQPGTTNLEEAILVLSAS